MILDWTNLYWTASLSGPLISQVFIWAGLGSGGAVVASTVIARVQTLGTINEQGDRSMFNTPTGLV
jgi:hypothetical protein